MQLKWMVQNFFVFGNAPTSIFKVLDMVEEGSLQPDAVSEFQFGFVGAAESKLKLHESSVPSIAALGQKGGSTIAAAVVNAILYQLKLDTTDYERYSVQIKAGSGERRGLMMDEYAYVNGKKLRKGFTTGTCATAATVAGIEYDFKSGKEKKKGH